MLTKKIKSLLASVLVAFLLFGSFQPAFAAVAVSGLKVTATSNGRKATGTLAFDSSYPTGGEPLDPSAFGLHQLTSFKVIGNVSGYMFAYDYTNKKIIVYQPASVTPAGTLSSTSAGTPAGTNSTSSVTGTAAAQTFTGSAYSTESFTVTHAGSPGGNPVYAKFNKDGSMYLACNNATTTSDKSISMTGGAKLLLSHDASASSGGFQVYVNAAGVSDQQLLINNTTLTSDAYLRTVTGQIFTIKYSATASSQGVAMNFDDGADQRFESNFGDTTNHNIGSSTNVKWAVGAPVGTNSTSAVTGTAAAQTFTGSALSTHTHTFTGTATTAAPGSQVANATDLSTSLASVKFEADGL